MITRYNLHNIFTFDIIDHQSNRGESLSRLLDINSRYQAFRAPLDLNTSADLTVEVGHFMPSLSGCNVLDDEYYVKPNYLYHTVKVGKLGGALRFDVLGLDNLCCKVKVDTNWIGRPFIPGIIIDFFIQYMLAKRGYSLVHASAVALKNKAALYSGRGGGGKTTIALEAVEKRGLGYLGDNFVIVKDGQLFSFPSDLNMFGYNLKPKIWKNLSKAEQLRFKFWYLVYRFSGGYIKVFTPVSPMQVFSHALQNSALLTAFNSLLTGIEFSYQSIDRTKIIKRTVSNQKLEFFSFVRHTESYGCLFPNSDFARHWEVYEDLLHQNLPSDIPYYQITMPERINSDVINQVISLYQDKVEFLEEETWLH